MSYPPLPSNGETQWGDKFRAWADALEGRKSEGPGLGLRLDMTVGERVFLDYPGGSTMVYGDTGWRDVSGLLDNSNFEIHPANGFLRLSRTNTEAHVHGRLRVTGGASIIGTPRSSRALVFILPQGFTPRSPNIPTPSTARIGTSTTGILFPIVHRVELMGASGSWTAGEDVLFSATVSLTDDWPTTLPGVPS